VAYWRGEGGDEKMKCHGGGSAVYGLGLVGAAVYYLQQASGLGEGVVGVLKALVWPGFLVYEAMKGLGM
jgi:hypothetical protein